MNASPSKTIYYGYLPGTTELKDDKLKEILKPGLEDRLSHVQINASQNSINLVPEPGFTKHLYILFSTEEPRLHELGKQLRERGLEVTYKRI